MTDRLNSFFQSEADIAWEPTEPGVKRKIMAYGEDLMIVRVVFEAGQLIDSFTPMRSEFL